MYLNPQKVITASILKPYQNTGLEFDYTTSHGWQVVLITGYTEEGYAIREIIDYDTEEACLFVLEKMGLLRIK